MDKLMKWLYSFVLLILTLLWSVFLVNTVQDAVATPTPTNVIEVSGVSVLLGALIVWNGTVNQHWFRKRTPDE